MVTPLSRVHGGPDARGAVTHDFSTNANACGPCPQAQSAIRDADPTRYPDPAYSALRESLAAHHGVEPARIVCAGSGSEFIFRITAWAARQGVRKVWLPAHGYGDYAQAAQAWGLEPVVSPGEQSLAWACDPSSPLGAGQPDLQARAALGRWAVLDRAYEPLRLDSALALDAIALERLWQLWTPNKALGLTGVRAAYAIAPLDSAEAVAQVESLAASWPLGSQGVAMLQAWCEPAVQQWLAASLTILRKWKDRQVAICEGLGWTVFPSHANFFVCRAGLEEPAPDTDLGAAMEPTLAGLRSLDIKVRDCASFGLPGHVRLGVRPPASQDALRHAMEALL